MTDWEGLKALEAKAGNSFQGGHQFANALIASFPAILARHEQDQRVISEIKRHLSAGATIRATDVSKFLESQPDGTIYGGLTVEYPKVKQQGEQITYDGTQLADLLATSPEAIQNRFEFADKTWSPWMTITVDEAGYCQYANVRHQLRGLYLPQQAEDKPKRGRDFWIAAKP